VVFEYIPVTGARKLSSSREKGEKREKGEGAKLEGEK